MLNFRRVFEKKVLILMYHRISTKENDPWELSVEPKNFEAQMQVLKQFNVINLDDLISQIKSKKIKRNSIAITFDDGYLDNYTNAKPILEKYTIPATFFITSRNIGKETEFWWDELAQIIFYTEKLPNTFYLNWKGQEINFALNEEAELTDCRDRYKDFSIYESTSTRRSELYYLLWEYLTPLLQPEQEELMHLIRSWAQVEESKRTNFQCMSYAQVVDLAKNSLFSIGGHTSTHPALSYHNKSTQFSEIKGNKSFLENITNTPVQYFAYPSGKYNDNSITAVQEAGFEAAVTTNERAVTKSADCYTVSRFQVNNWDGITFERKVRHWFKK